MYWRRGFGRFALWVAALTLSMCALAALIGVRSPVAAQSLALIALALAPPVHEAVARFRHVRAPARVALFTFALMLPVAIVFLAVDGVAMLEDEARGLGFASAAERERARGLKLANADALARHDARALEAKRADLCKHPERRPLLCFEPSHRQAALAFAALNMDAGEYEQIARQALDDQRKRLLAADRECQPLVERIDAEATPEIVANRTYALERLAALWAQRLEADDLAYMVERQKPGQSTMATARSQAIEDKIDKSGKEVDEAFAADIQSWSQRIVLERKSWRQMLTQPVAPCKPARTTMAPQ